MNVPFIRDIRVGSQPAFLVLKKQKRSNNRTRQRLRHYVVIPMVVIGDTNSSCFILNKIEVFPAPSSPSTTSLISILGPICTLLSFVKATGMAASVSHRLAMLVNCSCCSCTVSRILCILFRASITYKLNVASICISLKNP